MLLRDKYLKILSGMLPAGAVGVSLMLGSAAPAAADHGPTQSQPPAAEPSGVSNRLAAIRDAVSAIDHPQSLASRRAGGLVGVAKRRRRLAQWWCSLGQWRLA